MCILLNTFSSTPYFSLSSLVGRTEGRGSEEKIDLSIKGEWRCRIYHWKNAVCHLGSTHLIGGLGAVVEFISYSLFQCIQVMQLYINSLKAMSSVVLVIMYLYSLHIHYL